MKTLSSGDVEAWLENRNFVNMVYHYGEELRRVLGGERVNMVFLSRGERSKLLKRGILVMEYLGAHGGSRVVLSPRARGMLKGERE